MTLALLLAAVLAPTSAAQTYAADRGSALIDGSANVTSSGADEFDDGRTSIFVNPSAQYFIAPGLAVGSEVSITQTRFNNDTVTGYGAGPAFSYYFGGATGDLLPYLSAAGFVKGNSQTDDTVAALRAAADATYMLACNIGLSAELFYYREMDDFGYNEYGLAVGVSGFLY